MNKAKPPHKFLDKQEIIDCLKKQKNLAEFDKWTVEKYDLTEIASESVGSNTYRAFPGTPSKVFRTWALEECENWKLTSELLKITTQRRFDDWLFGLMGRLCKRWLEQKEDDVVKKELEFGQAMKLVNLLLKKFIRWKDLDKDQRMRLMWFLHIPLDKYVLVGIKHCVNESIQEKIRQNPTMSDVTCLGMYKEIQKTIRAITKDSGMPAIYFDVIAWDMMH